MKTYWIKFEWLTGEWSVAKKMTMQQIAHITTQKSRQGLLWKWCDGSGVVHTNEVSTPSLT